MPHRMDAHSQVDRGRHPALFQRVTRTAPTPEPPKPMPVVSTSNIYAAFVEFVQFRPAEIRHREERVRHASPQIWDYLDACGFHADDIQDLQLGMYTTAADLHGYLRSVGFSETAITESGLVTDERDTFRHDWHGCLIAPLKNERGEIVDVLAVIPTSVPGHRVRYEFAQGPAKSDMVAYGLKTALSITNGQKNLVLVEDIMEALYLQCRGFLNVAAVGGDGREFSPKRWEELARLGVDAVTLAFGNDSSRQRDTREALDHALRARTAPEVFVVERTQLLENETLADVARRHGLEACRKAASSKALAFHGKDFGWSGQRETAAPRNGFFTPATFHHDNYRSYLRTEAEKISHPQERSLVQSTISEVDEALYHRHYSQARAILDSRLPYEWRGYGYADVRTTNISSVLDRMTDDSAPSCVPQDCNRYDGNELQSGTVSVIANESPRGRLADFCSRLVTALETRTEETWVVVCREFSEETITLGLIAQMTRRMTTSQGLTFEEIQARLRGRDPLDGYSDKPWLVDEAIDRLRRMSDRLRFLTDTSRTPHIGHSIAKIADEKTLGGVFFDSLPAAWQFDKRWQHETSATAMLRELATHLSCAVVVATDHVIEDWKTRGPAEPYTQPWWHAEQPHAYRSFREMIAHWIEQEERGEIRMA